jgi:GDSL-like Lipase/Acylhydrolase family
MSHKNKRNRHARIWNWRAAPLIPERPHPVTYGTPDEGHVVLMGDSILDNGSYTMGLPDVSQRLHGMLGDDWAVTLAARDGATTMSLGWQLHHIPADATHLVLSIGGNDANGQAGILTKPDWYTMREALDELWLMGAVFAGNYEEAVLPLLELDIPLTICTIYDCDFPESIKEPTAAALTLFNDAIVRFAFTHGVDLLDLRTVVSQPEDFEFIIEPSGIGGAKIAAAIAGTVLRRVMA